MGAACGLAARAPADAVRGRELEEETGIGGGDVSGVAVAAVPPANNIMAGGKHTVSVFVACAVPAAVAASKVRVCEPDKCDGWEWHAPDSAPSPRFPSLDHLLASGTLPGVMASTAAAGK